MSARFSSAGLLYVYMKGYQKEGFLDILQVDSYHYVGDALYDKIMEVANASDEEGQLVHIFAIIGLKDKVYPVYSIFKEGIKSNFRNILSGKPVQTTTKKLDATGNTFLRCVQAFYCLQPGHFPRSVHEVYGDIVVCGIACSSVPEEQDNQLIDASVSLWLEREQPALCGKQLMTQSFFLRDLVGRKVIAALPDEETGLWRLIFDGGHQLYIGEQVRYTKPTLHPDDLGAFCVSNVQSILFNPIYAYGTWFQPDDICEEWHKVFLYLCAVSDVAWDQASIRQVYERFLDFLAQNICHVTEAPPLIPRETYHLTLLKHIAQFRRFLQGEDEPVLSKDLLQTLNSRYVYLPYLWTLIEPASSCRLFSSEVLQEKVEQALCEAKTYSKGVMWEDVAAYVLAHIAGWKITGRRIRAGAQEIDLSVAALSLDDALWQLGAYVLVECKNWDSHVDIRQIRNIAHISSMKGNKTAILFASNGITADAQKEIQRLATSDLHILCITASDLKNLRSADDCRNLILERWDELQDVAARSTVI